MHVFLHVHICSGHPIFFGFLALYVKDADVSLVLQ